MSAAELEALTALAAIDLPEACVAGVEANLKLLAEHWRNLEAFELPEEKE